jgi:hypothetical protein
MLIFQCINIKNVPGHDLDVECNIKLRALDFEIYQFSYCLTGM